MLRHFAIDASQQLQVLAHNVMHCFMASGLACFAVQQQFRRLLLQPEMCLMLSFRSEHMENLDVSFMQAVSEILHQLLKVFVKRPVGVCP